MKIRRKSTFRGAVYRRTSYANWSELPIHEKVLFFLLIAITPVGVILAVFAKATAPDDAALFCRIITYTVAIALVMIALLIAVHFRQRTGFPCTLSCIFGFLGIMIFIAPTLFTWAIDSMGMETAAVIIFIAPWSLLGIWMVVHGCRLKATKKATDNEPDYAVTTNHSTEAQNTIPGERRTSCVVPGDPKKIYDEKNRTATSFIAMGIGCIALVLLCTALLIKMTELLY